MRVGLIPGLAQGVKDPVLMWLWCRLAAVAPIQPQPGNFHVPAGAAVKEKQKKLTSWIFFKHFQGFILVSKRKNCLLFFFLHILHRLINFCEFEIYHNQIWGSEMWISRSVDLFSFWTLAFKCHSDLQWASQKDNVWHYTWVFYFSFIAQELCNEREIQH